MKTRYTFMLVVCLFSAAMVMGDSPIKPKSRLGLPAIVLPETRPEWIRMYRVSEHNPSALLPYLDDAFLNRLVPSPRNDDEEDRWRQLRWYALVRLGDIAGVELIPALEHYAQLYEAQAAQSEDRSKCEAFADLTRLTIERIRLRAQGRDVYVRAMIEWVRTPAPGPEASYREASSSWRRVSEGARALGVVKAREGVDALMERSKDRRSHFADAHRFCVRALARIGDKRAMQVLYDKMMLWVPYGVAAEVPLEPDEPDIVWAYWQMRTDGMTLQEAITDLVSVLGTSGLGGVDEALLHIGKPAVPALLAVLKAPDSSVDKKRAAIGMLARMGAQEAKDALLDILRNNTDGLASNAAYGLAVLGAKEALPYLMREAELEETYSRKEAAIRGLGELGDPDAEPFLLRLATQHPDPRVRREAVMALERAGTRATIPILEQRLQVEESYLVGYIQNTIDALRKKKR